MKKLVMLTALFTLVIAAPTDAQVVVKIKPSRPHVVAVKPACPGPHYVWIDGHWRWSKKKHDYVWVDGHWVKARKGHVWVDGHWADVPGGHKWVPGHWQRR